MRRPNKETTPKITAESARLINYAQAVVQAASRVEERYWEQTLDKHLQKVLKNNHQEQIDAALHRLFTSDLNAYDALMEAIEAGSESCVLEQEENGLQVKYDILLVVAPILAWTRYTIDSGAIPADLCATLAQQFQTLLLTDEAKLALAPTLYSIDQMPHSHGEAYALTQKLAQAALKGGALHASKKIPETVPFLFDTRYLVCAIAVPQGQPFFRWQMPAAQHQFQAERETALKLWQAQATPNLARILPGCGIELMLPEAYYIACREADKAIRPISIKAAVHYLCHTLAVEANGLRAVVAAFGDDLSANQIDEFRIAFMLEDEDEVVYGIVWPIYGLDEEDAVNQGLPPEGAPRTTLDEICTLLEEQGITQIKRHSERFPTEFCDDCGTPLFADVNSELVHPEMPEETPPPGGTHFH